MVTSPPGPHGKTSPRETTALLTAKQYSADDMMYDLRASHDNYDLENFLLIGVPIMASFITFFFGVYIGRLDWRRRHHLEMGDGLLHPHDRHGMGEVDPEIGTVTPYPVRTASGTGTDTEAIMVERPLPALPSRLRETIGTDVVKPRAAFFVDEGSSSMITSEDRRTSTPAIRPEDVSHAISVLSAALRLNLDHSGSGRGTPISQAAGPSASHGHGSHEADSGRLPVPPQYQSEWRGAGSSSSHESQASSSVEREAGPARPPRRKRG